MRPNRNHRSPQTRTMTRSSSNRGLQTISRLYRYQLDHWFHRYPCRRQFPIAQAQPSRHRYRCLLSLLRIEKRQKIGPRWVNRQVRASQVHPLSILGQLMEMGPSEEKRVLKNHRARAEVLLRERVRTIKLIPISWTYPELDQTTRQSGYKYRQ